MPSGYTSDLYEGKEQTFAEFVMQCARAFGACIDMRDDPWDKPIPEEFTSDDSYHTKGLEDAQKGLAEAKAMTLAKAERCAQEDYDKALAAHHETLKRREAIRVRYTAMLDQVNRWVPPSDDHNNLKKFMVEQLTQSIDWDCCGYQSEIPCKLTAREWRDQHIDHCRRDMAYHQEAIEKERQRVEFNNRWIRQLRESLRRK